ncbi:cytochrome P450 CYP51F1 [Plectosphaerella cucumerina]|uniref:Cytochrome P450 CYP51F1 n=1 Tax=Plectosphaerella cucumerina TaxID=40658 RepID=A0A8K0TLS4_9PEZI|nr:cytochrome P450 CYP51F1 [Plectosphaerella cucumerina]
MGLFQTFAQSSFDDFRSRSTSSQAILTIVSLLLLSIIHHIAIQILLPRDTSLPPVVFSWFPIIGSTATYGQNPPEFFRVNREKYGDIFTFLLLGRRITVYLGPKGNDFILNGKLRDVNAEKVYGVLTTPVFGSDVVYDCPNAKLMEQKKFMKVALTTESFRSYVPIIAGEVNQFLKKILHGKTGVLDVPSRMAELTIYTASHSLQGPEVRKKLDSTLAVLYHELDLGLSPANFLFHWAPLPWNRARDRAQRAISKIFTEIIQERRANGVYGVDPVSHLMRSTYKDGTPVPDHEIAHMMIALLMAGQHSSASTSAWVLLRLAQNPAVVQHLYEEQVRELGNGDPSGQLPALQYEHLARLPLHLGVVKETLRLHSPIHSIMRSVEQTLPVPGTKYVLPPTHTLMAAPGISATDAAFFPNPTVWDPCRWLPGSANAPTISRGVTDEAADEKVDYGYGLVSKGSGSPYLPFGAGRHRCIGEQFANVQLQTIVASVIRDFKLRNEEAMGNRIVDTDYASLLSKPLSPARVIWERREVSGGASS